MYKAKVVQLCWEMALYEVYSVMDYMDPNFEIDIEQYRQTSNKSLTKFQNLNVTRLILQLSLCNPSMPGV